MAGYTLHREVLAVSPGVVGGSTGLNRLVEHRMTVEAFRYLYSDIQRLNVTG